MKRQKSTKQKLRKKPTTISLPKTEPNKTKNKTKQRRRKLCKKKYIQINMIIWRKMRKPFTFIIALVIFFGVGFLVSVLCFLCVCVLGHVSYSCHRAIGELLGAPRAVGSVFGFP